MENDLIKKMNLDNGLELELYDASKKVAGDRWQVKVVAKIDIPVQNYMEDMPSGMDSDDLKKVIGEKMVFEKTMERNFIDDKDKEIILNGFLDAFTESLEPYFSRPDFPKQLMAKKYKEARSRSQWNRDKR